MRNIKTGIFFFVLILLALIAFYLQLSYGNKDDLGIFIVTALTAIGTCGVTVLNVFPYEHKEKVKAVIYFFKNEIRLTIENKTNRVVYLGTDKYSVSEYPEVYAKWWPSDKNYNPDDKHDLAAKPGDNLAIPPRGRIYYTIDQSIFKGNVLSKLKFEILTSSGNRHVVRNDLGKNVQKR
ncbi:MAG: hypothetical protein LBR69_02310 [Endomicrobium sp.]|jgi:hypothetical protein|nr:hypothetical protein [Endomicrobium sp.]